MKNSTITVFIPEEDFFKFIRHFKIISSLPKLKAEYYNFNGDEIRMYYKKMISPTCKQVNIGLEDYIKWVYYYENREL